MKIVMDTKSIYQLKVTLKGIKPPIWRRLLIPSNATFWELHIAIQDSFGWENCHLHEFYNSALLDRNAVRISLPNPEDDFFGEKEGLLDESKTLLADFLSEKQPQATYVYDFGDNWEHQIILERILPFDPTEIYPQVIDDKRACPWEDSGGSWGYQEKIKILQDKNNEYYKEIADWVRVDDFSELNLESFNPDEVIFRNPATELRRVQKAMEQ